MTCREVTDFLVGYLDGSLPGESRTVFEQHLAGCPQCREYLSSYQTTIALGRSAYGDPEDGSAELVPEELVTAILASLRAEPPSSQPSTG